MKNINVQSKQVFDHATQVALDNYKQSNDINSIEWGSQKQWAELALKPISEDVGVFVTIGDEYTCLYNYEEVERFR